jgi:hypothetical protein
MQSGTAFRARGRGSAVTRERRASAPPALTCAGRCDGLAYRRPRPAKRLTACGNWQCGASVWFGRDPCLKNPPPLGSMTEIYGPGMTASSSARGENWGIWHRQVAPRAGAGHERRPARFPASAAVPRSVVVARGTAGQRPDPLPTALRPRVTPATGQLHSSGHRCASDQATRSGKTWALMGG